MTLIIHDNASLKGKRKVVKSLIDKVRHRFDAAVAEVADHDLWQKAGIGVALVGNDATLLQTRLEQIVNFMEAQHVAEIVDSHVELVFIKR
uniref:DUF503 domain-containing protein n=1 Tax=Desulfobacca acetoxidans TaxID=60893 RepID=A0A7C5EQA9_9BACT